MIRWLTVAALVALTHGQAWAQKQAYLRMDGTQVEKSDKSLWQFNDEEGCYQCRWAAYDRDGKEINSQIVRYFKDSPKGGDDAKSNHWVYWFKVDRAPSGKETLTGWGRCPTPKHPAYKVLQKAAKGPDLWQIIPEKSRQPGVTTVSKLKGNFGAVFSTENMKLPKIAVGQDTPIDCIDFSNPLFN